MAYCCIFLFYDDSSDNIADRYPAFGAARDFSWVGSLAAPIVTPSPPINDASLIHLAFVKLPIKPNCTFSAPFCYTTGLGEPYNLSQHRGYIVYRWTLGLVPLLFSPKS